MTLRLKPVIAAQRVASKIFKLSMSYSLSFSGDPELQGYEPIIGFIIPKGHNQESYMTTVN
jgi:hypothetical protein